MGRREQDDRLAETQSGPCRLLKGITRGLQRMTSKTDTRAIMPANEIKAARLKDKSVMKSEVLLYEGDWQCQRIYRASVPQYLKKKKDAVPTAIT